jgi:hypothetical protein
MTAINHRHFDTPFYIEGNALYWEMPMGFEIPRTAEEK